SVSRELGIRAGRAVRIVRDSHRSLATRNARRSPIRLLRPRIRDTRLVPRATCRSVQSVVQRELEAAVRVVVLRDLSEPKGRGLEARTFGARMRDLTGIGGPYDLGQPG